MLQDTKLSHCISIPQRAYPLCDKLSEPITVTEYMEVFSDFVKSDGHQMIEQGMTKRRVWVVWIRGYEREYRIWMRFQLIWEGCVKGRVIGRGGDMAYENQTINVDISGIIMILL